MLSYASLALCNISRENAARRFLSPEIQTVHIFNGFYLQTALKRLNMPSFFLPVENRVWLSHDLSARARSHLIADQDVDACGTLFEYLVDLSGRDVKELSDLLNQLGGRQLLQVNGVIHYKRHAVGVSIGTHSKTTISNNPH